MTLDEAFVDIIGETDRAAVEDLQAVRERWSKSWDLLFLEHVPPWPRGTDDEAAPWLFEFTQILLVRGVALRLQAEREFRPRAVLGRRGAVSPEQSSEVFRNDQAETCMSAMRRKDILNTHRFRQSFA